MFMQCISIVQQGPSNHYIIYVVDLVDLIATLSGINRTNMAVKRFLKKLVNASVSGNLGIIIESQFRIQILYCSGI